MEGAARIVGTALSKWGKIDILATCAGFLRDRMVFNMAEEDFDAVVGVHLKGTYACARAAVGPMREQGYGRIITFTSGAGLFGNPGQSNYGSAKSAIGGLTKVLARDLGYQAGLLLQRVPARTGPASTFRCPRERLDPLLESLDASRDSSRVTAHRYEALLLLLERGKLGEQVARGPVDRVVVLPRYLVELRSERGVLRPDLT